MWKTPCGKHYHLTYNCHGATIPCGVDGLEPCADCAVQETSSATSSGAAGGVVASCVDADDQNETGETDSSDQSASTIGSSDISVLVQENQLIVTMPRTDDYPLIKDLNEHSNLLEVTHAIMDTLMHKGNVSKEDIQKMKHINSLADCTDFFDEQQYDIRQHQNGRWMDQKLTPDILQYVADCVATFAHDHPDEAFSRKQIWRSPYAQKYIAVFGKPDVDDVKADKEYDKVFGQPLCMLAAAGVLSESKQGSNKVYTIREPEILNFIADSLLSSHSFIAEYCERTLRASGLSDKLDKFLDKQDEASLQDLRAAFIEMEQRYTGIKKDYEPKRIFPKVINSIANRHQTRGIVGGRISQDVYQFNDLLYNRVNFRDARIGKKKGMSRTSYAEEYPDLANQQSHEQGLAYAAKKAQKQAKVHNVECNGGRPEYPHDCGSDELATNAHHMLMFSQYPEFGYYPENLIMLTPSQHLSYAHPENNTYRVDPQYQKRLLLAKVDSIEKAMQQDPKADYYSFDRLLKVSAAIMDDDTVMDITTKDFAALRKHIRQAIQADTTH